MSANALKSVIRLSSTEHNLLTYLEQTFLRDKAYPSRNDLLARNFLVQELDAAEVSNDFNKACLSRGLPPFGPVNRLPGGVLTELQLAAINVMLDFRMKKSDNQKLQALGLTSQVWQNWLADPNFQRYLRERSESILNENQHEVNVALLQRVRSGDIRAIDYMNQLTGRFTPSLRVQVDSTSMVMQILDVISRNVTDAGQRRAIADELIKIAAGANEISASSSVPNPLPSSVSPNPPVGTFQLPALPVSEVEPTIEVISRQGSPLFAKDPEPEINRIEVNL